MNAPPLQIVYEDNHLLAVAKPAGLPTMGAVSGRTTVLALAKQYVKARYGKPGNVYLGVVSRLDTPVTGVLLFARTSKAARRLAQQFRGRTVRKTYWALVEGMVHPASGEWVDQLARLPGRRQVGVVAADHPDAQEARTIYRVLASHNGLSLLELEPVTGRKHQLRVQSARRRYPIVGDRTYGSRRAFPAGIALHARRLEVFHPVHRQPLVLQAPVPAYWRKFGVVD